MILAPKKQGEVLPESVDFISALTPGTSVTGSSVTATVWSGNDPNPAAILQGGSSVSGTIVTQTVTGGVVGTIYNLLFRAFVAAGTVEISALLAIETDEV